MDGFGQQALLHIIVNISMLTLTWWALQAVKFDLFVKNPRGPRAIALMMILTVSIAHLVSSFLLDYLNWSTMLRYLF